MHPPQRVGLIRSDQISPDKDPMSAGRFRAHIFTAQDQRAKASFLSFSFIPFKIIK